MKKSRHSVLAPQGVTVTISCLSSTCCTCPSQQSLVFRPWEGRGFSSSDSRCHNCYQVSPTLTLLPHTTPALLSSRYVIFRWCQAMIYQRWWSEKETSYNSASTATNGRRVSLLCLPLAHSKPQLFLLSPRGFCGFCLDLHRFVNLFVSSLFLVQHRAWIWGGGVPYGLHFLSLLGIVILVCSFTCSLCPIPPQ